MESLSAEDRKRQIEIYLWQEHQKLETQMFIDQKNVYEVDFERFALNCPISKTEAKGLRDANFKKKLLKANLKIKNGWQLILDPSEMGFSREIKKVEKLFYADSEVGDLRIYAELSSHISWTRTYKKTKYLLSKHIHGKSLTFEGWSQIDLAQLLIFNQSTQTIRLDGGNFMRNQKSLEVLKNFHLPNSKPILESIYIYLRKTSVDELKQLSSLIKLYVEALLSSKCIESLKSIDFEFYYRSEENEGADPVLAFDWKGTFVDIPEIMIDEKVNKNPYHIFKIVRILFPKGQKQDADGSLTNF